MKVLNASPHHLDTPSVFQDRKMDGPNSINNYSPLTMTPKLLTLQLPMMISTTTTSHNVAHVPSDRNTVLGNKFSTRERGEIVDLRSGRRSQSSLEMRNPGRSLGYMIGQFGRRGSCENLKRTREKAKQKLRKGEEKCGSISEVTRLSLMRCDRSV